ncbi:MAG: hypothetical protein R2707_18330 [Acidimicrobiales bacterium]
MTDELTGLCRDHSFETAENICRRCGLEYCELCLVFPFGAKKPLCKECAMVAGGVRSHAARPEMPKRDLKRRVKVWEARNVKGRSSAHGDAVTISDPLLTDPLAPTEADLERVPVTVPDHGADVAAALAESFGDIPPPPPAPKADEPADGVAPPIDWSQPFG